MAQFLALYRLYSTHISTRAPFGVLKPLSLRTANSGTRIIFDWCTMLKQTASTTSRSREFTIGAWNSADPNARIICSRSNRWLEMILPFSQLFCYLGLWYPLIHPCRNFSFHLNQNNRTLYLKLSNSVKNVFFKSREDQLTATAAPACTGWSPIWLLTLKTAPCSCKYWSISMFPSQTLPPAWE